MSFEGNEYMIEPTNKTIFVEEGNYALLIRNILEYIGRVKSKNPDAAIVEIIMDYAFKENLDIETVGDAIASDEYFKSFIEADTTFREIEADEW